MGGLLLAVILYTFVSGPVYSLFGVTAGDGLREMMSIPSQQIARVYNDPVPAVDRKLVVGDSPFESDGNPSKRELDEIEVYYDKGIETYVINPLIADLQKGALNVKEVKRTPFSFVRLYIRLFLFVCAYMMYRKRSDFFIPIVLISGLLITYFLSPVCLFGYCFAFFIVAPPPFFFVASMTFFVSGSERLSVTPF